MQEHLKIRLTGAIILVVLVVSLVPEMFRGRPEGHTVRGDTSADDLPLRSYTIDQHGNQVPGSTAGTAVATPAAAAPVAPAPAPALVPAPTPGAVEAAPVSHVNAEVSTMPAAAAGPAVAPASVAAANRWAVQVGTFSRRDFAERMVKQVRARGFTVVTAGPDDRGLYRVRSAAFSARASAEALRQKMVLKGLKSLVNAAP